MDRRGREGRRLVPGFLREDTGTMTILTLVFFVVIMAFGGLAIDIGRLYAVHGQMQAYVDEMALAAASQLDGQDNAIYRACLVVTANNAQHDYCQPKPLGTPPQSVVSTSWSFTTSDLAPSRIYFLDKLGTGPGPTPDVAHGDSVLCYYDVSTRTWISGTQNCSNTNNQVPSELAKYVAVSAVPMSVNYLILPIAGMFGDQVAKSSTVQLQATAGYTISLCNTVPFMLCNPNEASAAGAGAPFIEQPGQQVHLLDGQTGPGTFGLINTLGNNPSGSDIRNGAALLDPGSACSTDTVTPAAGYKAGPVQQGMNVRFDIYSGPMSPSSQTPPAENVIKGAATASGTCANATSHSSQSMPLPDDDCFTPSGFCSGTSVGNGIWNHDVYWAENHPGMPKPTGYSSMTRYQVYLCEQGLYPSATNPDPACTAALRNPPQATEMGSPLCGTPVPSGDDRRVVYAAVVNCLANSSAIQKKTPVPILAVAQIFLTGPTGDPTNFSNTTVTAGRSSYRFPNSTGRDDTYGEIIRVISVSEPSGHVHSMSTLYR